MKAAALEFDATHRGRAGDSDAELVTLELLLTDAAATPLTDARADDLFVALSVYLDDGSGVFEPGVDTEVTFVTSFALTPEGMLTVPSPTTTRMCSSPRERQRSTSWWSSSKLTPPSRRRTTLS